MKAETREGIKKKETVNFVMLLLIDSIANNPILLYSMAVKTHSVTSAVARSGSLTPAPVSEVGTDVCMLCLIHMQGIPYASCLV